ncbi:MAG: ABC transporter substrate-binding protein, partial [Lacisediminihabitans sp.]
MAIKRKSVAIAALTAGAMLLAGCAGGPTNTTGKLSDGKVVLGVLNDQSGVYKDLSGPNSVVAVQMAVADYKAKYGDKAVAKKIEIVSADHQNKPDLANTKAQEMYDRQNVDVILDVPASPAALAVATVAKAKKKLFIDVGAATTALTGASCNKYTFHWAYDTAMLAKGAASVVTNGGKKWSILYPDNAFGQDMQKSFNAAVQGAGGTIQQDIPVPSPNDNFATFITKAASSNPDVIGTMSAGGDLINFVKQFNQAGMRDKATLAVGLMFITDIHSLGVDQFAGTTFTDAWYWNLDSQNRKWADRFTKLTGTRPSFAHAANYSAALQYLEAVQRAGTDNSDAVVKQLEGKDLNDVFLRHGKVRADHNVIHDTYLAKVKSK